MSETIHQRTTEWPAHLSVGVALVNREQRIAVHRHEAGDPRNSFGITVRTLMRETPEDRESYEDTAHRGLQEEMGARAILLRFLGSVQARVPTSDGKPFCKTTLYYLAALQEFDPNARDPEDPEGGSTIEWLQLDEAYELLGEQENTLPEHKDLHEAVVIAWVKQFLESHSLPEKTA